MKKKQNEQQRIIDDFNVKVQNQPLPFVITVRNMTRNTLVDVPLFDYLYRENKDVRYESVYDAKVGYQLILNEKLTKNQKIDRIVMYTDSKNQYHGKQLNQNLKLTYTEGSGRQLTMPLEIGLDPMQQQSAIVATSKVFTFKNSMNLVIPELYPDMEVTFTLFPVEEINEDKE